MTRRQGLALSAISTLGLALPLYSETIPKPKFNYCLNTSTLRGQELTLDAEIEITAKAGYQAIEPWANKIADYKKNGNSLADLKKRIADLGLKVVSAIGFAHWIVDDEKERQEGFEQAKLDMDLIAQIGGTRLAAPPAGATKTPGLNLDKAAQRYAQLCDLGKQMGVTPQIEVWGHSQNLSSIKDSMYVALASGHPDACFLGDIYHLYKGGSDFDSLRLLGPHALQVFHFNDYPSDPPRETIKDEHRIYPGDGIAPITEVLHTFAALGANPYLSLELFNRTYWKQDALSVATTGLKKMQACVDVAFNS